MADLSKGARFSPYGPVKTELMKTAGSNVVLFCHETGQTIPPHPERFAVVSVVLQGEGFVTLGNDEHPVAPLQ